MNLRLKRLMNEYNEISEILSNHSNIIIKNTYGNPPEKYIIEYRIKGLEQTNGEVHKRDVHLVEINLPSEYPSIQPTCRMTTPVFHPNIDLTKICIADYWAAGESLLDVIIRIGKIISYQNYNIKSPLNGEAARWAEQNMVRFPIDTINLEIQKHPSHTKTEITDKNIFPNKINEQKIKEERKCANCGSHGDDIKFKKCKEGHIICSECIIECKDCSKSLCIICSKDKCFNCSQILCSKCQIKCPLCGNIVCKEHQGECCVCQCGAKGKEIQFQKCSNGHLACPDCILECTECGKLMCVQCETKKCESCGEYFCKDCHKVCTNKKSLLSEFPLLDDEISLEVSKNSSKENKAQTSKVTKKMLCTKCGYEILDKSDNFCVMCGAMLDFK